MPRAFESDRQVPIKTLIFTEIVDCPACGEEFEGDFSAEGDTVEDMVEAPTGAHVCPGCRTSFATELTGWHMHQEAG